MRKRVPTPSGKVTLALRPERVSIHGVGEPIARGRITSLVYMGTDVRITVELAEGMTVALRVPPPFDQEVLNLGSTIPLSADTESLRPLMPEAEAA